MAAKRYKAVAIDEKNIKAPDEPVKIIEKDMPRPGSGEVLVRIFLRPVSVVRNPVNCARPSCKANPPHRNSELMHHTPCR